MKLSDGESFVESFSRGIDILQRCADAQDEQTRKEVCDEMARFSCGSAQKSEERSLCEVSRDEDTFQIFRKRQLNHTQVKAI